MVQINGEQVEASKVVGKTLLAYVTEAGYDHVGIVIEILHFVGGGQF